ncbi:uncharacterized protein [Leptinotarsa decemlineata]|uniref:uncharacterized protein n=1 Tax=Leptinotarsa decemlineata TaxID=7539 RepID=UPI000C2545FC|nr:uncharacterized protein LOC111502628 [Leptinotarsa decemlineata]XP_023012526.1 uncharacterized protein LOC111502628 [Leptinotarsa decemlineata]XP_023012534.1 uncharacterized protein LOC111502628 [Leptinotarsa decemlineata]
MGELDEKVLFAYFEEKSKVQKSSSLWAQFSMLKYMISMKKNIDISKYTTLLAFLKKNAVGYQAVKSKNLTKQDVDTFLREADDHTYLLMKVALIIGVAGECNRHELSHMLIEDVKDEGSYFRITIPNSLTKSQREFIILAETINGLNLVEIIRKYINIRPSRVDQQRFFVAYRNGKCVNQPVGVNTIGIYPKKVASFLGLPDPEGYIGYRFGRTSRRGSRKTSSFTDGFND